MSAGGFDETPLKKEKGARLGSPWLEMLETHAIGRGAMHRIMREYTSVRGVVDGSMIMTARR
jgi:hypothetical protein